MSVPTALAPKGNTTGFMQFEYGLSGKWLELMKEIMPNIARIGVIRDDEIGTGSWSALHSGP